ncbi:MAG: hypothetical protein QNK37_22870 [Acidobacteriota bacterium]|nr:hypothetical protein [Acidobacteriota bacterium]
MSVLPISALLTTTSPPGSRPASVQSFAFSLPERLTDQLIELGAYQPAMKLLSHSIFRNVGKLRTASTRVPETNPKALET